MKCVGSISIFIVISMIDLPRFVFYGAEGRLAFKYGMLSYIVPFRCRIAQWRFRNYCTYC